MSSYRNGQPNQLYNTASHPPSSPVPLGRSVTEAYPVRGEPEAGPGSDSYLSDVNGRSRAYSYTSPGSTPDRQAIGQAYVAGPRPPRLQYPVSSSTTVPSVNGPTPSQYQQPQYASAVQGPYNPQDYAQATPTSPTTSAAPPGAGYSPQSYVTPSTNYSPAQYTRYEPARYHNAMASVANRAFGSTGGSPVSTAPIPPPPQDDLYTPSHSFFSQSLYGTPLATQYSPRGSNNPHEQESPRYADLPSLTSRHFQTPPAAQVPPRDSSRDHPSIPARGPSSEQSLSQVSTLHASPSPNSTDASSHYFFENSLGYSNYASSGEQEFHSPSFFPEPSPFQAEHTSPQQGLHRMGTTGRHPQSSPLPRLPPDAGRESEERYSGDDEYSPYDTEDLAQEALYQQVESAMGLNVGGRSAPDHVRPNGFRRVTGPLEVAPYGQYTDESDAEAAAGLAVWATPEEIEDRRLSSGNIDNIPVNGTGRSGPHTPRSEPPSEEDDYPTGDLSSYGGGFQVGFSYGGNPINLATGYDDQIDTGHAYQSPSSRSSDGRLGRSPSHISAAESPSYGSYDANAYIDQSAGGFADPRLGRRKMSFTEGDERDYLDADDQALAGTSTHTGSSRFPYSSIISTSPRRPHVPPPLEERTSFLSPQDAYGATPWATTPTYPFPSPDSYTQVSSTSISNLSKSISLTSPPATPQPRLLDRSKTDGEDRKRFRRLSNYGLESVTSDALQAQGIGHLGLDLPTLPVGRRFQPAKLSTKEFDKCTEPWALSSIISWLRGMAEGENELRQHAIVDALLALFNNKVSNMHIAEAETLAAQVVKEMFDTGVLVREEEWLRFGEGLPTGVLYQLTGRGCYASKTHNYETVGKCYSTFCQRTVKRIDLQEQGTAQAEDWVTYHRVSKEDVERVGRKEVERQNILHEIVTTEQGYLDDLGLLRSVYREGLQSANPGIISPNRLLEFLDSVFGKLDAVRKANEQFLLPQLKYRQRDQGPWINGFSDIFRDWIRKAKAAYIDYAANFPRAFYLMKQEEQRNNSFVTFSTDARNRSRKLGWDSFLKLPITRLQQVGLLLQTVLKKAVPGPEMTNLQVATDEIKAVTLECDARVAEQSRKVDLHDLESKLILRDEMKHVELNLTQRGRELLFRGDLQRTGQNRFTWLETHAILLDNYLILAKIVSHRDGAVGPRIQRYDVSKMPIPMDLLVLDSDDDPVVVKVRGIATVTAVTPKPSAPSNPGRTNSNHSPAPGNLVQVNTNISLASIDSTSTGRTMVASTNLEGANERLLYPFRIKHLGLREPYILYASKAEDRKNWVDKIIEAKTKHASSLYRQSAEPFGLRVVADSAFAYETFSGGSQKSVLIRGTPLSRAIDDIDRAYSNVTRPGPICRARVNCATTFLQPFGKKMMAIGTDYGVYVSELGDARGWTRAIAVVRVTQIAVLEEFNLVLLISDKVLIAYHLDVVCPASGAPVANNNSTRKAPQKLSGSKDVGFFATGRMKDRTLVFYKKKDGLQSTFRILEPILQKATERRSRLLHRGTTEFFREYDDGFYIPTECTSLDLFTTTLAVATSKGFEVLNLDKKTPFSVPDLKQPLVATIAARLQGIDPLAMFRLSDVEFLCVYEECAVYMNKHGDVSRKFVLEFVAKAKAAALEAGYLILFDTDFVEIRDTQNGRLKQVIPGRDVRCLDNGRGGGGPGRTIKFALQHPEQERTQIVVELVLNQGAEK